MTLLIQKVLTIIIGKKITDVSFSGYIAKNSIRLFLINCIALILGFISNYVLIKVAGVSTYGAYVYIFNLLYLLAAFCVVGTDTLLVKKIAVYEATANYAEWKGILLFSLGMIMAGIILVTAFSVITFGSTWIIEKKVSINWLLLSFLSLLMLAITMFNQASLQALRKVFFSQVTEKIIRPLLLIIPVLILFYRNNTINAEELVWMNIIAVGVATLITIILHKHNLPVAFKMVPAQYKFAGWIRTSFAFFLLDIFYIFNSRIDVFLLGLYRPDKEVGIYNITLRLSELIGFGLIIMNFLLAPLIARIYASSKRENLQRVITRSARAVLLISLPLAVTIFLFRHSVLSFFDADTLNSSIALVILCAGQLLNVFCGSPGLLLNMTGHQKFSILSLAAGTILNLALSMLLVPAYGLIGTAIATASSLVAWNLIMYFFVRTKLKIHTTAFAGI